MPGGGIQPVWPADEPLRITRCDVIAETIDILWSIPLGGGRSLDALGTAFDAFLRGNYEHAGGLGTYLTPHTVVEAMVEVGFDLINPFKDWNGRSPVLGDPCCGSGRFLVAMLEGARRRGLAGNTSHIPNSLVGADQSPQTLALARVNLLAYGLPPAEVFSVEDSIVDRSLDRLRGNLRLILTNPPFGEGKYDSQSGIARTLTWFPSQRAKQRIDPALAFVARCLELLEPDGVVGIILPDGVADGPPMRELVLGDQRLTDQVRLEGIISLPVATFASAGTMAKTSIVFLRKAAIGKRRGFLARANHVGHVMRQGVVSHDPEGDDLPTLATTIGRFLRHRTVHPDRGHFMTLDVNTITSLDASSFDADAIYAKQGLLDQGGQPFTAMLRPAKKRRVVASADIPFVSVLHVDELGSVDWELAEKYRPTAPGIVATAGQVIVSLLNPAKFRATVVPERYPLIYCSAEFGVFDPLVDPYVALAHLQHPAVKRQIAPLGRGTSSSRRRIDSTDVLKLISAAHDDAWMSKAGRRVCDALAAISEARHELRDVFGSPANYR